MGNKETKEQESSTKTETKKDFIDEKDFDDLEIMFKFVRGNNVVIDNEKLMADAINYKSDLFLRMRNTLDALEEPLEK